MASIPASSIVSVIPSVISAGGAALDLNGLFLTTNTRCPAGTVLELPSLSAVQGYFGATSDEAVAAGVYFGGFDNSNAKPGTMLFAQFAPAAVSAYLRGANLSGISLTALKTLTGTLSLVVDGVTKTASGINLAAATSFSNAATIIQGAFTSPGFTVTFDSTSEAFVFTDATTGAASSLGFASGTLALPLGLTQAAGAVLSQGSDASVVSTFMASVISQTQDWACFCTLFDPDNGNGNALKLAFAAWTNSTNNRFVYVATDTDVSPTTAIQATGSFGYAVQQANYSGTFPVYDPNGDNLAAFVCGMVASIDFTETNGRITAAFKSLSGIPGSVTSDTVAQNLIANGYNFYGVYATANDGFTFLYPGSISGKFKWLDAYVNQVWLNNSFQLAILSFLTSVKSLPYTDTGYGLLRAACTDTINQGLNFGAFRTGVPLSAAQVAEVNFSIGKNIGTTLSNQGWYLDIEAASAQVRSARKSPPMTFLYMDGGSIQSVRLASVEVQ